MVAKQMQLEIIAEDDEKYSIRISDDVDQVVISFDTSTKDLQIPGGNALADFLVSNESQFRGILHNKKSESYYKGFKLKFSIIDGKDIAKFKNRDNIIIRDRGKVFVESADKKNKLPEVYTDASYDERLNKGAYCVLRKDPDGLYEASEFLCDCQDSNSAELEAVIKALEIYDGNLRIVTDSQYVRKGITEWIIHWKLNNWHTANGTKAKNINMWKRLDKLCENRRIEFGYVKAHNNHFENEYCDLMARIKREEDS
jgi:ribonuclease HI